MQLVLASHNTGKLQEFTAQLLPYGIELISLAELTAEQPAETGQTFIENAIIKARFAGKKTGLPVLADDSGLVVDALGGRPGIYSSRYAGVQADDAANREKLLAELADRPDASRKAYFYCVLVLMRYAGDPMPIIAEGTWRGEIVDVSKGSAGFGYDPLFYVPEQQCVAAELPLNIKIQFSHRGQAVNHLLSRWSKDEELLCT